MLYFKISIPDIKSSAYLILSLKISCLSYCVAYKLFMLLNIDCLVKNDYAKNNNNHRIGEQSYYYGNISIVKFYLSFNS